MPDIEETLAERGSRYSDFRDNAIVAQDIKQVFRDSPNWHKLPGYMQEGLDMFASKMSRMLTGDILYDDNIHDIIGYAKLMQDRMKQDRETPLHVDPVPLPPLDLGDFKQELEKTDFIKGTPMQIDFDADFLFERVMELGFLDSLGFALALLGCAGFRVNDDGKIVNDADETPDAVYLGHFHSPENPVPVVDGSSVPHPSFFRDGVRDMLTRGNTLVPVEPVAPPPAPVIIDNTLRQDMWDDHKGRVAWAYTASDAVAKEFDSASFDDDKAKIDWLLENVLADNVDLYNMRQQDTDGVWALGAFEIPNN